MKKEVQNGIVVSMVTIKLINEPLKVRFYAEEDGREVEFKSEQDMPQNWRNVLEKNGYERF